MTIHDAPRIIKVDDFSIGQRLDNYLIKQLKGVPKSRIYRIIRKGEVRVNKGRKKADVKKSQQLNKIVFVTYYYPTILIIFPGTIIIFFGTLPAN